MFYTYFFELIVIQQSLPKKVLKEYSIYFTKIRKIVLKYNLKKLRNLVCLNSENIFNILAEIDGGASTTHIKDMNKQVFNYYHNIHFEIVEGDEEEIIFQEKVIQVDYMIRLKDIKNNYLVRLECKKKNIEFDPCKVM